MTTVRRVTPPSMPSLNANQRKREQVNACSLVLFLLRKAPFPAFVADGALAGFPHLEIAHARSKLLSEGLSGQPQLGSVMQEPGGRVALQEGTVIIQQVSRGNAIKRSQPVRRSCGHLFCLACFQACVHAPAHAGDLRDLLLHQPPAVAQPAEPVRDAVDGSVAAPAVLEELGVELLSGGVQRKLRDI